LIYYYLFDYKYDVKFYINIGEISNIDVHIEGYIKSIKISSTDNKDLASQALGIRVYDEKLEESISNYETYKKEIDSKRFTKFSFNYRQNTMTYYLNCPLTIKESVYSLFALKLNNKNELVEPLIFKNIFSKRIFSSYDFQPYLIKNQTISSFPLNKIGTNLIEFISGQVDETIEDISISMIGEVEQVNSIKVDNDSAHKTLYFVENGEYEVPLQKTSDGTVHFLAIMSALIANENNTISIMFEEPERHMHMKVLSYILSSMRENKAQIFFTTHSTEMLSELNLDEIVFMFRDYDGDTKGQRAKDIPNIKDIMKLFKNDLVSMIQMGVLGEYDE